MYLRYMFNNYVYYVCMHCITEKYVFLYFCLRIAN